MTNQDLSTRLNGIEAAIRNRPDSAITGGQLYDLMTAVAPNLDFREIVGIRKGPGALTAFVENHLGGVLTKAGNQGGDVLYQVDDRRIDEPVDHDSVQLWKNFVSPQSPRYIVFEPDRPRLASRLSPASAERGEKDIAKASYSEHDNVRKDFMNSLSEGDRNEINRIAGEDCRFQDWMIAIKEYSFDIVKRWGVWRKDNIFELFCSRIKELNLEEEVNNKIVSQIRNSQKAAYSRAISPRVKDVDVSRSTMSELRGTIQGQKFLLDPRELAQLAIEFMAIDDVRSLRIPLGAILDAMQSKR
jgi:hypothetical protein